MRIHTATSASIGEREIIGLHENLGCLDLLLDYFAALFEKLLNIIPASTFSASFNFEPECPQDIDDDLSRAR
ncbi:hypothetical protein CEQ18_032660 [Pseudomonas aeruginosa]|nr:hypothetical protein CEQ18_032660 [Pseudomonas aeruginosa]